MKKIFALLLVLGIILCSAACKNNEKEEEVSSNITKQQDTELSFDEE